MPRLVGKFPWAVVLCKFNDHPEEPQAPQFFRDLFVNAGTTGLFDYWRNVSYGNLDLTGSEVFGWFRADHSSQEISTLTFPRDRSKLFAWGLDVARANNINLSPFFGTIIAFNVPVDSGAISLGDGRVCLSLNTWNDTFAAHEMGHGFGWVHSFGAPFAGSQNVAEYGDHWDIMSALSVVTERSSRFPPAGPGSNAPFRDASGWIPPERVTEVTDFFGNVLLTSLTAPGSKGSLMAKIFAFPTADGHPDRPHYFTVEYRQPTGFDAGLSSDLILIHEVRPDGNSYLMWQPAGPQSPAGKDFLVSGETFSDPVNRVRVTVSEINPASATAMIQIISGRHNLPHNSSSNFIQGSFGLIGNFELVVPTGTKLLHFFRDNDAVGLPWHGPVTVHDFTFGPGGGTVGGIPVEPTAVSLLESNFNQPGNLELVAVVTPTIGDNRLVHFFRDSGGWHGPFDIVADGKPVTGVTGDPSFLQGSFGRQGNFEMVVPMGKKLLHFFRDNDAVGLPWHGPVTVHDFMFGSGGGGTVGGIPVEPTAVSLLESNFNQPGNLELVAVVTPTIGDNRLVHFFRDTGGWHGPNDIVADGSPITGVTGHPSFIQGSFGRQGNFEMVVPMGRKLLHFFRDNDGVGFPWHGPVTVHDFTLGPGGGPVGGIPVEPTAVSLLESNFNQPGNLELVAVLTPTVGDDRLAHFFRDTGGWHGPIDIVADGTPVTGVTGF